MTLAMLLRVQQQQPRVREKVIRRSPLREFTSVKSHVYDKMRAQKTAEIRLRSVGAHIYVALSSFSNRKPAMFIRQTCAALVTRIV